MLVEFRADLHIHTCLSPCSDLLMSPLRIVEKAASFGLNIIAICDHNSIENAEVTRKLAKEKGINAIPGIEITSSEEVHILGLFRTIEDAMFNEYLHIPWVISSDAHKLSDIGKGSTALFMNHSTFDELCLALKGAEGRRVIL